MINVFSNIRYLITLLISCLFVNDQLEESGRMENLQAQRCRARLDHLESMDVENLSDWNRTRLKRILVDYMLRMSYYDTATKFAETSNIEVTLPWNYLFLICKSWKTRAAFINYFYIFGHFLG